nr:protein BASIC PENTACYSTEINE2-like [Ipomoea batatas]
MMWSMMGKLVIDARSASTFTMLSEIQVRMVKCERCRAEREVAAVSDDRNVLTSQSCKFSLSWHARICACIYFLQKLMLVPIKEMEWCPYLLVKQSSDLCQGILGVRIKTGLIKGELARKKVSFMKGDRGDWVKGELKEPERMAASKKNDNSPAQRAKPAKKSIDVVISGVDMDMSSIPTPPVPVFEECGCYEETTQEVYRKHRIYADYNWFTLSNSGNTAASTYTATPSSGIIIACIGGEARLLLPGIVESASCQSLSNRDTAK